MTNPPRPASSPEASFPAGYSPPPKVYDESVSPRGGPRAHWAKLCGSFERLGCEELAARWENGRRIIGEHGVTYNVYGDPQGMDRPWELDMVPLIIPPDEWRRIEAGLAQRARLLNIILADIYGPQRLLREGVLPPALVFANPAFLRPCNGIRIPQNLHLHLHACDLARAPDGHWWVLADRTQAPSGTGYALENRVVLSRILPDEFRDCQVQRLSNFFRIGRETLLGLASCKGDNPNVVLLTPGPRNETYFEHAYLARYLGFTLVEGGDLTVRDRRVFVKTLEGLQRVDIVLRRLDDTFCDPLELRGDSFLGVPGLVEAVRAGHVAIANALGSGVMESPAFLAFLPSLCRHLLGEPLKLPSVATWWCGQAAEQQYVLDHLDDMVIKPALMPAAREPLFAGTLRGTERANLIAAIRGRPFEFVGQEHVSLSTAPVWSNARFEPRRIALRAYVTAVGDSFAVMPGGLTRVSTAAQDPVVSMQSGGGSKDTWVLSEEPDDPVAVLAPSGHPVSGVPVSAGLPSRVADNLFWLGRYAERLEGTLRVLRAVISHMAGEGGGEGSPELAALTEMLVGLHLLPRRFHGAARPKLKDLEQEVLRLICSQQHPGGVLALLMCIRHISSMVRDRFSSDTWRILNKLQADSRVRPARTSVAHALALLNTLIVNLGAFSGMEMENMTRGHGWRFLDFGRRLERGTYLVGVARAALAGHIRTGHVLEALLEIADSSITYRLRYFAQPRLPSVLDLLLLDESNPRSLAFQVRSLTEHAAHLPRDPRAPDMSEERRRIDALAIRLREVDVSAICQAREHADAGPLESWLTDCVKELGGLSDDLTHHYFSHTLARLSP